MGVVSLSAHQKKKLTLEMVFDKLGHEVVTVHSRGHVVWTHRAQESEHGYLTEVEFGVPISSQPTDHIHGQ